MKKLDFIIYGLFIVVFVVWFFVDILKLIWVPVLTYFGMTHWVPEVLLVFCIGADISTRLTPRRRDIITLITFLYPWLYYMIQSGFRVAETIFGFGAGCVFSGVFLAGIWYGKHHKQS